MQDHLNAIRRLYGEPGPEGAPAAGLLPEAEAEAEALAAVKAALDALPPQRPDAATLGAVFAAAEETALAPVRSVYENAPVPPQAEAEVAALAAMKAGLDALPPQRPDAATLAAVLAAAAPGEAAPPAAPSRAEDRPPRRNGARRRVVVALSAVFMLALVFSTGLWLGQDDGPPTLAAGQDAPAEEAESAPAAAPLAEAVPSRPTPDDGDEPQATPASRPPAEPLARAEPPVRRAAPPPAPPAETAIARTAAHADFEGTDASAAAAHADEDAPTLVAAEALPLADGDDELRLLYLRMLEMQAAQAGLGWGEPPVALGTTLDSVPPSTTGWMQVRVER